MLSLIQRFCRDEQGATATEYAILIIFIALAVAFGANILGKSLSNLFSVVGATIQNATSKVNLVP